MANADRSGQHALFQAWSEKDLTIWDQNRETIRRLFIVENRTLVEVKRILEADFEFPEFRMIDYEVVLREHFGFRKNLKKEDWLTIDYYRGKRRQEGKASNVYLQGLLMEKPKVDRAVRRSKANRRIPNRSRREPDPLPEGVTIRTPSPVLPRIPAAPSMSTTNGPSAVISVPTLGQSVHLVAPGPNALPINIDAIQTQVQAPISVEEIRLGLPFNKFAELIILDYNFDVSTPLLPIYTRAQYPMLGLVELPAHPSNLPASDILSSFHPNATERLKAMMNNRRDDRLTARNIAFVGGKFEFEKLMRVFFVLSNKQMIHENEGREIIEWVESANLGVLRALFSLPSSTVAAAWEQLMGISRLLKYQNAFLKLVEIALTIQSGAWLRANAGDVLGTAIWLGLAHCTQRLLRDGLPPNGTINQSVWTPFSGYQKYYYSYDGENPLTPLQVAILLSDADIIMDLFRHGVKPDKMDTRIMSRLLLRRTNSENHSARTGCLKLLLDAGLYVDVEILEEPLFLTVNQRSSIGPLGWLPNRAKYLSETLWHRSAHKEYLREAFALVSKHSKQTEDSLTIPGLCDAASRGCGELLRYLNSRSSPSGNTRNLLLEVALSQAVSRGDLASSQTFIQMGVDPSVQELYSQTSQQDSWVNVRVDMDWDLANQWFPAFQASKNCDKALLEVLCKAGVDYNQHNLVHALLSEGEEQWTSLSDSTHPNVQAICDIVDPHRGWAPEAVNDTYNFLLTAGVDIQIHGSIAMARAVMRWGRSEPEMACLQCDWLHSKGIDWNAELEGQNLVHCAVKSRCDLDLVRFLVARGAKVHSSPCHGNTTMLHDALQAECSLDVIDFLLDQGANIHDQSYGGVSILQPVLSSLNRPPRPRPVTPLNPLVCKRLIEAGATVFSRRQSSPENTEPPSIILAALIMLPEIEDEMIIRLLDSDESINLCYDPECITRKNVQSPLQAATETGRLNLARELLCRGRSDQNASLIYSTALHWSTKLCVSSPENRAALDFMMFLIDSGADIETLGADGLNPLHHAAKEGSLNIASVLLENRADPNTQMRRVDILSRRWDAPDNANSQNGFSVVRTNYRYRHPSKGEFGLDEEMFYFADGSPHLYDRRTYGNVLAPRPLDLAAFFGRLDMVQLLLSAGGISGHADVTPYDGAVSSAQLNGHHTIVRLLEETATQLVCIGDIL